MAQSFPPHTSLEQRSNNWGGNHRFTPALVVQPEDEQEVLAAVRWAEQRHLPVRTMGAGHSFSPLIPTGGVLLKLGAMTGLTGVDTATNRVRVQAATSIGELAEALWEKGLSLPVQGDHDVQTIAGALATGTHGSGVTAPTMSEALTWLRLVSGSGEIVEIGEDELEHLRAARVSLGALGVVLEVELQAVPAFHLRESRELVDLDPASADLAALGAGARHVQVHWFPTDASPALLQLPVEEGTSAAGRALVRRLDPAEEGEEGTAPAHQVFTGRSTKPFHEMELAFPSERADEAFAALTAANREQFADMEYPMELRWVAADDSPLSIAQGGDRVSIALTAKTSSDYWPFLIAADAIGQDLGARAHLGKLHLMTRERLAEAHPRLGSFTSLRAELDPEGLFLNDHLRSLLG
ncbi:FAD-binding protein [Brachybacterium endophyticum]|uniref:FAD-binding protein n=1 Tax=Brachybacterium endophyticum TaxID=2182385 RepID=A0A2U2RKY8_9MICO|nr:D-arabinono-1,4-lactone oxidase [Brachybacterium endophyticum]PWH06537.1 FAD-binding protein [Brachybacterium endophyticum]